MIAALVIFGGYSIAAVFVPWLAVLVMRDLELAGSHHREH